MVKLHLFVLSSVRDIRLRPSRRQDPAFRPAGQGVSQSLRLARLLIVQVFGFCLVGAWEGRQGKMRLATIGQHGGTALTTPWARRFSRRLRKDTPIAASTAIAAGTSSVTGTSDVLVDYATSDGTARAGSDYTSTAGTLTFRERLDVVAADPRAGSRRRRRNAADDGIAASSFRPLDPQRVERQAGSHQVNRRVQILAAVLGLEGVSSHSGRRRLALDSSAAAPRPPPCRPAGGWRSAVMVACYASAVAVEDGGASDRVSGPRW